MTCSCKNTPSRHNNCANISSETPLFDANTTNFRVLPDDLDLHVQWLESVTSKLNAGSDWFIEIGHNGNGNIEVSNYVTQAFSQLII